MSPRHKSTPQRGAIVLEAVVGLPILIIAVIAIAEFGLLSSRQAVVHAASRAAADAAVRFHRQLSTSGTVPVVVVEAAENVLSARGIDYSSIRVEHMRTQLGTFVAELGTGAAQPPGSAPSSDYVRVSVCVDNAELSPNLLRQFLFDLSESSSQQTTTRLLP